jgi:hypothetical protein
MSLSKLSVPDEVVKLLAYGPYRSEIGRKQLTLAFGGLYVASTTASAKPLLVWETEKGYARYYIPTESLHGDIKQRLDEAGSGVGNESGVNIEVTKGDSAASEDTNSKAVIERLTVASKSTTWVRFIDGPFKGFIRFERSEIGAWNLSSLCICPF